jgi:PDZ domain-containing secreted protein
VHLGSVYVYGSVGNIWSRQSKILAADGAGSDLFGASVSIYSTISMIGAQNDDDKVGDAGNI